MNKVNNIKNLYEVSDVHIEFYKDQEKMWFELFPEPDPFGLLLLNGDIQLWTYGGKMKEDGPVFKMLDFLSKRFKAVVYIPGNHEYYRGIAGHYYDSKFKKILKANNLNNIFLLNNDELIINEGVARILGSTLWTSMDEKNPFFEMDVSRHNNYSRKSPLNDLNKIRFTDDKSSFPLLNVRSIRKLHNRSKSYLNKKLNENFAGITIVATHHVPTNLVINEELKVYKDNLLPAYVEPLEYLVEKSDVWFFAHTHQVYDKFIESLNSRLISNAGGYKHKRIIDFDPNKVFIKF